MYWYYWMYPPYPIVPYLPIYDPYTMMYYLTSALIYPYYLSITFEFYRMILDAYRRAFEALVKMLESKGASQ